MDKRLEEFRALPGGELVVQGLTDLSQNKKTIAALLILVAKPRLLGIGIDVNSDLGLLSFPEEALYHEIAILNPNDTHAKYNAYIREITSFTDSAEGYWGNMHLT